MRAILFLLALLAASPAWAQQNQCRTSPPGASTPYCSSEAFVTQSIAAGPQGTVTGVNGAGLAGSSGGSPTPTITVTAASKTDEQAGSSATVATTPSQQQSHDSAAKAWVDFTGSTAAVLTSYNVKSVTRNSVGNFTISFASPSVPFASASYVCQVTPEGTGVAATTALLGIILTSTPKTASAVTIGFLNAGATAFEDPTVGHLVCFGRQ